MLKESPDPLCADIIKRAGKARMLLNYLDSSTHLEYYITYPGPPKKTYKRNAITYIHRHNMHTHHISIYILNIYCLPLHMGSSFQRKEEHTVYGALCWATTWRSSSKTWSTCRKYFPESDKQADNVSWIRQWTYTFMLINVMILDNKKNWPTLFSYPRLFGWFWIIKKLDLEVQLGKDDESLECCWVINYQSFSFLL